MLQLKLAILLLMCLVPRHQSVELVEVMERLTTTEPSESETGQPATNEWMARKIGAGHILNDVLAEEEKSENEIPSEENSLIEKHPCNRECVEGEPPRLCEYLFKVEWYQTMSKACYDCPYNVTDCYRPDCVFGDGARRPIVVVNRQMPGPAIEVCLNDEVLVEVENDLMEEGTSVHWHGQHQKSSPFMDGVPFVTQCPIFPKSTFAYRYKAETSGTHFWHSHSALQRGDGMYGALIVRVPKKTDPHEELYDFDLPEHTMIITDWSHSPGISKFIGHYHSDGDNKPESLLVNGKGRYVEFEDDGGTVHTTPLEKFNVQPGKRYRFRVINAGFLNCPLEISIDNHTLVVVNSDGFDLEPEEATSLVTYAGERFDFIVQMDQDVDNYWIRYRGLMDCDERFTATIQTAVLHYEGAPNQLPEGEPTYENSAPQGMQVNALNSGFEWNNTLNIPEMKALSYQKDPALKQEADRKFFISYDFYDLDNPNFHKKGRYGFHQVNRLRRVYTPQMNHISMKLPPFPMMLELDAANELNTCNDTSISKDCKHSLCECTHVLRVPLGAVAEIILVDKGFTYDANHPFHLHGHAFRVVGMDRLGRNVTVNQVKQLDAEGKLRRNFNRPPVKDTITVPDGGYTILRWHASNPGYWLFHCHIDYHVELGMAIVFKVGEDNEFPAPPPNFPRCNSYLPHRTKTKPTPDSTKEESISYQVRNKSDKGFISEIEFDIHNSLLIFSDSSLTTSNLILTLFISIVVHII